MVWISTHLPFALGAFSVARKWSAKKCLNSLLSGVSGLEKRYFPSLLLVKGKAVAISYGRTALALN